MKKYRIRKNSFLYYAKYAAMCGGVMISAYAWMLLVYAMAV